MKLSWVWLLAVSVGLGGIAAEAQPGGAQKPAVAATGSVTGHVYCGDTNAPARMATIVLEAAKDVDANVTDAKDPAPFRVTSVQTSLDGSFFMAKVRPGSYYVIAIAPGYVSPFAALGVSSDSIRNPDKELKEKFLKLVPRVVVQANLAAGIEIRLERGAAISGTARYDDGGVASGLEVHMLVKKKDVWAPLETNGFLYTPAVTTDDEGGYRFSGLPAGEYVVEAELSLTKVMYDVTRQGGSSSVDKEYSLKVYKGGKFRAKDAKPVEVKLGDQIAGEDLDIPLSKLHLLSGVVTAARDGHTVNSCRVRLLNSDDKSEVAVTKLTKDSSTFSFIFVPEGDYLLRTDGAKDVDYEEIQREPGTMPPSYTKEVLLHAYGATDAPLHIDSEMTAFVLRVPELDKNAQQSTSPAR